MAKLETDISERISILRIILIYGIVVLHAPPYIPLTETGTSIFDFIKALTQHAVFRCSVPVLTCVSGYLLFSHNLDNSFKTLFIKKTRTILIPLILFSAPVAVLIYLVQRYQIIDHNFSGTLYPFEFYRWVDAVTGLFGAPANYPLNFLRDLFVISIAAPLFGFFLRKSPWLGLFLVFIVFFNNLDGQVVLRNSMPITFYVGGMAAVLAWDIRRLDSIAPWLLLIFLGLCISTVLVPIENRTYLRLVSPILIWPLTSILVNTKFGGWVSGFSKYSFALFLMHGPLLLVAWVVYQKLFGSLPYFVFWLSAPMMIAIVVVQLYKISYRSFPSCTRFVLGGR